MRRHRRWGDFLCEWAIRNAKDTVLEPCAGRGALIRSAQKRFRQLGARGHDRIIAVEKKRKFAEALHGFHGVRSIACDFLALSPTTVGTVKAVVANPPFFPVRLLARGQQARLARSFPEVGRRGSVWAYFLAHARTFLADAGRLAFVLPWQLVTTDYGREALSAAVTHFASVEVLLLCWDVFQSAQVQTLLLLCEEPGRRGSIRVTNVSGPEELAKHGRARPRSASAAGTIAAGGFYVDVTRVLRLAKELQFVPLTEAARVRIGTVTGADSYFLLSASEVAKWQIPRCCLVPALTGPKQFSGLSVLQQDWKAL